LPAAKRAVGVRMSRGYKRVGYLPRLGAPFLLVLVACAVAMQSKTDPQHVSAAAAAVAPGMIVMVVIYVAGRVGTRSPTQCARIEKSVRCTSCSNFASGNGWLRNRTWSDALNTACVVGL